MINEWIGQSACSQITMAINLSQHRPVYVNNINRTSQGPSKTAGKIRPTSTSTLDSTVITLGNQRSGISIHHIMSTKSIIIYQFPFFSEHCFGVWAVFGFMQWELWNDWSSGIRYLPVIRLDSLRRWKVRLSPRIRVEVLTNRQYLLPVHDWRPGGFAYSYREIHKPDSIECEWECLAVGSSELDHP